MSTTSLSAPSANHLASTELNSTEIKVLSRLGFWSSILTTLIAFGYGLAVIVMATSQPGAAFPAGLTKMEIYVASFKPVLLLPLIPSLLLAPAFTALMVCIHYYAAPARRIWSHLGLAYTLIYAVMAFMNYIIELVSVQRSFLSGETDGLGMFIHTNPHAIFWALVSAYVFMNLAMLFTAPVFKGGRLETWIRRFFLLNGYSVVVTIATIWMDNPPVFMLASLVIWCPIFLIATALLAVLFSRLNEQKL